MTDSRHKIESSLAARGRPLMWANEKESASLSGYSADDFRADVESLEDAGFPKKNARNGKRFVPHIIRFWEADVDSDARKRSDLPSLNIRDFEDG